MLLSKANEANSDSGSILETRNTSFPILFVNAEIDPVTPKRGCAEAAFMYCGLMLIVKQGTKDGVGVSWIQTFDTKLYWGR